MVEVILEKKVTPPELQDYLTKLGGKNPFGEPNFRLVWGYSRLSWLGGKWENGAIELREVPKYFFALNRWIIERWFPAEFFGSPESWKIATDVYEEGCPSPIPGLGPYPERGDWEHCFTIETPEKEFVQATPQILRRLVELIDINRQLSDEQKQEAREGRERAEEEARKQKDYAAVGLDKERDLNPVIHPFNDGNFVTVL